MNAQNLLLIATVPITLPMSRCSEFKTARGRPHAVLGVPNKLTTGLSRAARSAHNKLIRDLGGLRLQEVAGRL